MPKHTRKKHAAIDRLAKSMNFYSWTKSRLNGIAEDTRQLPEGVTISDHQKHCTADKRKCPYIPDLGERQKALLDEYKKNGVTENLVEDANALFEIIVAGRGRPLRLPAQVFQNEYTELVPKWMRLAYIVSSSANDISLQDHVLIDFSKASGGYIDNIDQFFNDTCGNLVHDHGTEADVYHTNDGCVVKNSSLDMGTYGALMKIERILLGNIFFPETAYTPFAIGIRRFDELRFALRQPEVQKVENPLSQEEIERWMNGRGWTLVDDCAYVTDDKKLRCQDMHEKNVVMDTDGDIVCIDSCVLPYYNYDAPPAKII